MKRALRLVVPSAALAIYVLTIIACDDKGAPCNVDRDCPTGDICRDQICGSPRPDGGDFDADITQEAAASCSSDGVVCTLPTECCSGQCTENKCGLVPGGTPTCKMLFDTCIDDCCQGLTCQRGLCKQ